MVKEDILLPYQRAWMSDESEVKIWEKSRRIGASYVEALASVLEASKSKNDGGQSTYYLSYNKEMTRQFIDDCAYWSKIINKVAIEAEEVLIKDEDKDITVFRVSFASGFQIWGLPSEPRSLRSKQGRVIIDEAAFVEDLPALLKAAMALLMWGGSVRILSTHFGEDNPFNELIKEVREGKKNYSLHKTTITDAMEQGLYKRICLMLKKKWSAKSENEWLEKLLDDYGDGAAEELYCIPSMGGTKYLSRTLVESCMSSDIPVLRYECDDNFTFKEEVFRVEETANWISDYLEDVFNNSPNKPSYFGMDFGRSGDLSEIAFFTEEDSRNLHGICYVELRNVPFAQQYQIICYCIDNLKRFYAGAFDARGNGQMISELAAQKYGESAISMVMISRKFYMEYFPKYKARFEDQEILLPEDPDIKDDHRVVVIDKGVPVIASRTSESGNKKKKRHGDSVVAGVMAVYAYENDEGEYQPGTYEGIGVGSKWLSNGVDDDEW